MLVPSNAVPHSMPPNPEPGPTWGLPDDGSGVGIQRPIDAALLADSDEIRPKHVRASAAKIIVRPFRLRAVAVACRIVIARSGRYVIIPGVSCPFDLARLQVKGDDGIEIIVRGRAIGIVLIVGEAGLDGLRNRIIISRTHINRVPSSVDDRR